MALLDAVVAGDLERVRRLLEPEPARARATDERGRSALDLALAHGASPDQEKMGSTTLHLCARSDARDLAALLLEHGADPSAVGHKGHREGRTPLERAEEEGFTAMTDLLRERMRSTR